MTTHNPAAAFYASPAARGVAALLRGLHRLSPDLGTRVALNLFFTPVPTKWLARSRDVPRPWVQRRLPFEGGHISVWQRSDIEPGRPKVLLTHGWAGDAQQMRPLADTLAAAGLEPVLLDLPAHGRSSGWRSNLLQWVRALFAVTARFGPWDGVIAHSLGALAVSHALARGLPARRAALIALAPPPGQFLRWFAQAIGTDEGLALRMRGHVERREGVSLGLFEPAWLGERVVQPTLLVHDRGDLTAPLSGSETLLAGLGAGRLHVTESLGHRRLLNDPAVMEQVLGHFLMATSATPALRVV
ncbi:pimeloyl-ACP methyl ester carboxylesterase [Pelomonas saccharophila]|uniref:Pimeloyl-ACP methyl ester carboxylesterase n=1 Tax=Roseateles saccharophilus TaxID=304 RepID=A0ABU1YN51_ROSSA|nr:alpha/beta fold hydrolase [Roseateles saccharophilus]MDR7269646.1 pimeloyl-ACP methyl ester carboxylesterase [Roseateles saccharophilus]